MSVQSAQAARASRAMPDSSAAASTSGAVGTPSVSRSTTAQAPRRAASRIGPAAEAEEAGWADGQHDAPVEWLCLPFVTDGHTADADDVVGGREQQAECAAVVERQDLAERDPGLRLPLRLGHVASRHGNRAYERPADDRSTPGVRSARGADPVSMSGD